MGSQWGCACHCGQGIVREACQWDSGCSKQGQTVKMEAEPSTDAVGDDTATTGLTSCSPFYFIFFLQLSGLKVA